MGAGEQIPSLLLEKELSACRDRALLFLTDLEFLAEPREAAAVAFTLVPSTGAAFAAALCIPAAMLPLEGGLSPLPRDPSAGKTHSPIPAGIFLCTGEQGDGESPWHRVSHPAAAPGLAGSRGCSNSRGMFTPKQFCLQPHPGHKVSAMQKGFQAAAAPCTAPLPCLAAGMPCRTHGW